MVPALSLPNLSRSVPDILNLLKTKNAMVEGSNEFGEDPIGDRPISVPRVKTPQVIGNLPWSLVRIMEPLVVGISYFKPLPHYLIML